MHATRRFSLASSLVVAALAIGPHPAAAQAEWGFSPGVKLAWSPQVGVTYGFEISFVRVPDLLSSHSGSVLHAVVEAAGRAITRTYGIVWNLDTNFDGFLTTRLGVEWVGPFTGLELGPALVRDEGRRHFGFGVTPWLGYSLYPFYTHTFVLHGRAIDQLGVYLKTPLLALRRGNDIDFDDDD